ncbi:MAG: DUF4384 domain-containing protein [Acidobacteriota bacterium]|nr:DUF4384 domain-containing protein [Acidobacteriota bacterium]
MRRQAFFCTTLLLCAGAPGSPPATAAPGSQAGPDATAAPAPIRGAKELFYDPAGGGIVTAQPFAEPPAGAPPAANPGIPPPARKAAAATAKAPRRKIALRAHLAGRTARNAIGLSYWIELKSGGSGPGTEVTDARTFHSGERLRLHFRSNADGEVYLIQLGASGAASVLFPDPAAGLSNGLLLGNEERILPSEASWFRFDDTPGKERILVLFAKSRQDLESFPIKPAMDAQATMALLRSTQRIRGSKDLFVETENRAAAEIGTYGVNVAGQPVVLEIDLEHR